MRLLLLLLTIAVGVLGAWLALKLRLPAACMVGSMFFVILLNVLTPYAYFPYELRVFAQMLSGAVIGLGIQKNDLYELKRMFFPVLIMLVCMVILNVLFGAAIYATSDLDITTSLFASAPGGMTDMAIISGDLGANPSYVAILQLCRLIFTLALLPPIFAKIIAKRPKEPAEAIVREEVAEALAEEPVMAKGVAPGKPYARWLITSLIALAGGSVLYVLDVPAGAILGALIATVLANLFWGRTAMPKNTRRFTQTFAGIYIGTTLTSEYVRTLPQLFIPVLIMAVCVFMWCFLVAFIIHKLTKLPYETCMLSCAPGGLQDMCLLSDELGMDTSKIAVMQTARLVGSIAFFPSMLIVVREWF